MSPAIAAPAKPAAERSGTTATHTDSRHAGRTGGAGGAATMFAQLLRGASAEEGGEAATAADARATASQADGKDAQEATTDKPAHAEGATATAPDPNAVPPQPTAQASLPPPAEPAAGGDSDALAALRDAMGGRVAGAHRKAAHTAEDQRASRSDDLAAAERSTAALGAATPREATSTLQDTVPRAVELPRELPAAVADGALPSLGAVADAPRPPPPAAAPEPSAPAQASLPASPGTPAFAPALGLQLSTWLREGVQHASLELHPQELGPIDVRIAVKDGQTRIDLAADVTSTRHALQEALPQLAAALGDVGLALSGGGVTDQGTARQNAFADAAGAGGSGQGQAGQGRSGGRSGAEAGLPAPPAVVTRHRGLLDLYA
jgi:flagellar hook-length control protein FliK